MLMIDNTKIFSDDFNEKFKNIENYEKPQYSFYIPSKGRHDTIRTKKLLKSYGLDCYVVVEPQDADLYKSLHDNVLVMDKNNQGIYYVRNWIKDYSKSIGEQYHWQLDDDLISLNYNHKGTRYKLKDFKAFSFTEDLINTYDNIGMAGFIHGTFAFTKTREFELNRQQCAVVLVNNSTPCRWEPNIIEDTDYSLQLLFSGYCTLNVNIFSHISPPTLKYKGGNSDDFREHGLYKRQVELAKKYSGHFVVKEKDGKTRVSHSRIWSKFKTEPIKKHVI